jgi:hypothetical protein
LLCFRERGVSRSAGLVPALKKQLETEGCPPASASLAGQMLKSRFGSPTSHHLVSRRDRNLALKLAAPCVARTAGNRSDQRGRCWQRVVLLAREHLASERAARHLRSILARVFAADSAGVAACVPIGVPGAVAGCLEIVAASNRQASTSVAVLIHVAYEVRAAAISTLFQLVPSIGDDDDR